MPATKPMCPAANQPQPRIKRRAPNRYEVLKLEMLAASIKAIAVALEGSGPPETKAAE